MSTNKKKSSSSSSSASSSASASSTTTTTTTTTTTVPLPPSHSGLDAADLAYVDTHCHIELLMQRLERPLDDFGDFRQHVYPATFQKAVNISCDPLLFDSSRQLMDTYPFVHGSFGVHPHNAKLYNDDVEARLRELIQHPKCNAVGEMGLDYFYNLSPKDVQQEAFQRQLRLAVEYQKSAVIHTRDADEDTLRLLQAGLPKDWTIHIHCFTGTKAFADALLSHFTNVHFGFTGAVTFKTATNIREVVQALPLDRILFETDAPYMAPIPFRGKTSHSGYVPYVADVIATTKGVSLPELYKAVLENSRRVYALPL